MNPGAVEGGDDFGGASNANDYDNRSRYREVGVSGAWRCLDDQKLDDQLPASGLTSSVVSQGIIRDSGLGKIPRSCAFPDPG
jgi:hypothetical protein